MGILCRLPGIAYQYSISNSGIPCQNRKNKGEPYMLIHNMLIHKLKRDPVRYAHGKLAEAEPLSICRGIGFAMHTLQSPSVIAPLLRFWFRRCIILILLICTYTTKPRSFPFNGACLLIVLSTLGQSAFGAGQCSLLDDEVPF